MTDLKMVDTEKKKLITDRSKGKVWCRKDPHGKGVV